jgi:hypothetical protein
MAGGASTSVQIQVSANSTGDLDASIDVTGSAYDPVSTNNSAQTSTQVDPPASGTPVQIPLPPWAQILLGALLALLGWNSFSRQPDLRRFDIKRG